MRRRGKPGPQRDLREFEIGQTRAPHPKSGQHQQTIRFAHQPAGDRVAERLLEVVKLLRLKQIGPAEPGRGQLLLSPPQRAVRVQQGVFPGGPGDAHRRRRIAIELARLVAGGGQHRPDHGRLARDQHVRHAGHRQIPVVLSGSRFPLGGPEERAQSRDLKYVDDIARGTIAALRPVGYEVINLGSDRPTALLDAIGILEDLTGRKANVKFGPPEVSDVRATWADIHKAKRILDWEPRWTLADGLAQLVTWYKDNRAWARDIQTTS